MRYKKIGISLLITLLLLIPISRTPNNPIVPDVKANTFAPVDPLKLLIFSLIGAGLGLGADYVKDNPGQVNLLVEQFILRAQQGIDTSKQIYDDLQATVNAWTAENFIAQGQYTNNPILIPKDLLKLFNREMNVMIESQNLHTMPLSQELLNLATGNPYGQWFDLKLKTDITYNALSNTFKTVRIDNGSVFQSAGSSVSVGYENKYLVEYKVVYVKGSQIVDLMTNSKYTTNKQDSFNWFVDSQTTTIINSSTKFATAFNSTFKENTFPMIYYKLGGLSTISFPGSTCSGSCPVIYGYYPLLKTWSTYSDGSGTIPHFQSLEYIQTVKSLQDKETINEYPDNYGNNAITNNITNNAIVNNYGEALNKNDATIALPTSPNSWADPKTDEDTVIPSYTGSLPTLQNGVLTNTDGSVYPLPQFPTPSIDVSWDILATLQNLFSWLASVLKWIVDMSIYGLYMILAQLGLTQYFNLVLTFLRSILDLITSFFKFLFKALATIPDFFKFIIALLALIFDSILKFINLIITLIIHTFYNLINSALLSYTSITRLLPSPLNYVANATVSLVTSFLTFKVIKNIIGGLRS